MRKAFKICTVIAACMGVAFLAFAQGKDDPLDSLKVCAATQKLILENKFVRVIDDVIPVGVTEPMHRHPHGVVVYLTNYTNEQTTQEGKKTTQARKAGTASWSEATVHTVKTVGTTPSHAIRIELKF
jgi:histone acetyltransferase (RNA polymerase elongator complex component)